MLRSHRLPSPTQLFGFSKDVFSLWRWRLVCIFLIFWRGREEGSRVCVLAHKRCGWHKHVNTFDFRFVDKLRVGSYSSLGYDCRLFFFFCVAKVAADIEDLANGVCSSEEKANCVQANDVNEVHCRFLNRFPRFQIAWCVPELNQDI